MIAKVAAGSTRAPATKARHRYAGRAIALAFSLAIHLAVVGLFFLQLSSGRIAGGSGSPSGTDRAITVTFAGLKGSESPQPESQTNALDALFRQIRSEQSDLAATDKPTPAPGDINRLFDVVAADTGEADRGAGKGDVDQGGRGASPGSVSDPQTVARSHGSARAVGPGAGSSADGLWRQIEICWSQLPSVSSVPVTLEVSLNDAGRIAVPPKIMRPSTQTADRPRLVAEARALAAVTACVPYRPGAPAGSTRTYRVEFAASPPSSGG